MTETIKANEFIEYSLVGCNGEIARQLKSDVIFIRAPIFRRLDDLIRIEIEKILRNKGRGNSIRKQKYPRLTVLLETNGGYVEVVERINNIFRKHYVAVDFVVPNYAYSAGTVLVLSGDNIYMDYYSVLGPIDPQLEDSSGTFKPGMGYLYKYNDLVEKSRNGEITDAELFFMSKRFDPAIMFIIEQAKNHSEDLIKEWLPKYKFKNWKTTNRRRKQVTYAMKKARAAQIADILGDAAKWHSHGRGISMRELCGAEIKLKINNFGEKQILNDAIRQYYDLFVDYITKTQTEYAIHSQQGLKRIG